MGCIYKYIDKSDGIVKYVGTVWSKNRTLAQRINEHKNNDEWCKKGNFTIEYIEENINTRTDAEYFESHYISLYGTDKYFNKTKQGWGVSSFLPDREKDWKKYEKCNSYTESNDICIYKLTWTKDENIDIISIPAIKKTCKKKKIAFDNHCKHCGSNNLIMKETNHTCGQMYCLDCGEWVCQGNRDLSLYYTPEYNGDYEYDGEKIKEYNYYILKRGQKYPGATESELTKVFDGYNYALNLYPKKNYTHIFTFAINECEIEEAKTRLLKYIIDKGKQKIDKIKKRLIEIEEEKMKLPNEINFLKTSIESLNLRFADLLICC